MRRKVFGESGFFRLKMLVPGRFHSIISLAARQRMTFPSRSLEASFR